MIVVTRLNGEELVVNAQHIESVERGADTRVTLVNGKQLFVREQPDELIDRVADWMRAIHRGSPPISDGGW